MQYFEITVKNHSRFEPYHDVAGYEVTMTQVKDFDSWVTEEDKQHHINEARKTLAKVADSLKDSLYNKIEKTIDGNTIYVVYWYSIGD